MKKKYIVPTLVVAMLVLFPAISWYYLKTGLKWRREAMGELSDYGSISGVQIPMNGSRDIDLQELEGELLIFYKVNCADATGESATMDKIRNQFKKRPDVRIFAIGDCLEVIDEGSGKEKVLRKIDCKTEPGACAEIERSIFRKAEDRNVAFIDGNQHIRNYYHSNQSAENKRLVEHMAMMLPDERRKYGKENQEE